MAKFSIDGLGKKYSGFSGPIFEINLGSVKITDESVVQDVRVELSATYEASSCSFTICDSIVPNKEGQYKVRDNVEKAIKLGTMVTVSTGYKKDLTQIFAGYIDSVYLDYSQSATLSIAVECLDAKGIMMNSYRSEVIKGVKKYSDAVTAVLNKYKSLIKKLVVTDTSETTTFIEQHNESDYDFVVRLAKKINFGFYTINNEAHFVPLNKAKTLMIEFEQGDYLQSAKLQKSLKGQVKSVTVRGNNEKDPAKPFEATVKNYSNVIDGKNLDSNPAGIITNTVSRIFYDASLDSAERAKLLAEAKLAEISYTMVTGKIVTVGIPDIIPGHSLGIKGFGLLFDGPYHIRKITHILDKSGYTTEYEVGANKL